MGLIGSLLKGVGKIAKAGLSVATRGVSDKVLTVVKALGKKNPGKAPIQRTTQQEQALINKIGQAVPRLSQTSVISDMRAGKGQVGTYSRKAGYKSKGTKRSKGDPNDYTSWETETLMNNIAYGSNGRPLASEAKALKELKRRGVTMPGTGKATPVLKAKKKAKRASSGTRKPPPGGLDLAKMAAAWRSAGKPGRWIDWIKSNQIRRK